MHLFRVGELDSLCTSQRAVLFEYHPSVTAETIMLWTREAHTYMQSTYMVTHTPTGDTYLGYPRTPTVWLLGPLSGNIDGMGHLVVKG